MKYWIFACCAAIAITPWIAHPGYLFFIDWQGTPTLPWISIDSTNGIAGSPITILWHTISLITGVALAQKLIIGIALALAGISTARLAYFLTKKELSSTIVGLFALFNFFVVNRVFMGHIYVLFGYALTPFAIIAILQYINQRSRKNCIRAAVTTSLIILTSIHFIIILPILIACLIPLTPEYKKVSRSEWVAVAIAPTLISAIAILYLYAPSSPAITQLNLHDLSLFAPQPQCFSYIPLDSAILASSWRNPIAWPPTCAHHPFAIVATALLLIPILRGVTQKRILGIGIVVFLVLASVSIIPAMRDSGKFLAGLAILESVALAYGIPTILNKRTATAGLACITVVGCATIPLIPEISKTTTPHDYPTSWYAWNASLHDAQKPIVLFLPWHLYMPFDFSNGTTIGNPAATFFTNATIIQGDNYEMQRGNISIASQSNRPISKEVEATLAHIDSEDFSHALKDLLMHEHIQYIALAHGSPEESLYEQKIQNMPYLTIHISSPGLTVWKFVQ